MTAIKDAWAKVREGLRKAVRAPRNAMGQVGKGFGWATSGVRSKTGEAWRTVQFRTSKLTARPRGFISRTREQAREHPTLAVAIVGGALVGIAWIAWAIYVTSSNGANAGLGVLITWPVLIGAVALIAAPFVLTWMLVKRFWPGGEGDPPIAGGANGEETTED